MKKRLLLTLTLALIFCITLTTLASCSKKVKEEPKAEFSSITKMYAGDGISVIMDGSFKKYYPDGCSLAAENGDLKFEAFYIEKYYFTENGRNIATDVEALEYVNPGKDSGAEVELNYLWQPYVEFVTPDTKGTENDIRMYYVCIDAPDRYWFCTFFSYDKNFEEYRMQIYEYLETLTSYEAEKSNP